VKTNRFCWRVNLHEVRKMNQTEIKAIEDLNELNKDIKVETDGVPMRWHHKACRTDNLFVVKGIEGLYYKICGRWITFSKPY
jgi:hypothetical protein